MAFIDFDYWVRRDGVETYRLNAHGALPAGSYCFVRPEGGRWVRKTRNEGMRGSTRYAGYRTLQEALDAAQAWARRKIRESHAA